MNLLKDGDPQTGRTLSYKEVGDRVGRAQSTIIKLAQRESLIREANPDRGGRRSLASMPILSEGHRSLGIRLNHHRELSAKWNLDQMARHLGKNRYTVQLMELGKYDFTLSDLNKISTLLGQDLLSMVAPFNLASLEAITLRAS